MHNEALSEMLGTDKNIENVMLRPKKKKIQMLQKE